MRAGMKQFGMTDEKIDQRFEAIKRGEQPPGPRAGRRPPA